MCLSREQPRRPPLSLQFEPRFCSNHVADLSAGCSFGCIYCPFADIAARRIGVTQPTAVDLSSIEALPAPPTVFLSPASDAFAPQAAGRTHALLAHWLPRGTVVGIVTKGVIPSVTLDLLARYREQIEGVAVGVSSLDADRNRVLEPGCPPAAARLDNIDRLAGHGLTTSLRMDPLFPGLDDDPAALASLVNEAARRGAWAITASYVFTWGRYRRRLRREPLLTESSRLLTERAPMEGGQAWSVPLARKIDTYSRLAELANTHGLRFNTCGCKDLRVRDSGLCSASCRNTWFLAERTGPASTPLPALNAR